MSKKVRKILNIMGKPIPVAPALRWVLLGGKWKTVILYHLMEGTLRYSTLRKAMPSVTERTLSLQLKKLEADGIVKRKVYYKKPPLKVEYSLTELGETLIPVITSIAKWGDFLVDKYSK